MFEQILVPVDGSEGAIRALKSALEIQQRFDSEILILSVFRHHSLLGATTYMPTPGDYDTTDSAMRAHASDIVDAAKAIVIKHGVKRVRGFVKGGPTARTIVSFAEEHKVNLIALGGRGLGDIEGFLLGSVSHKVTGLAKCPVLIV